MGTSIFHYLSQFDFRITWIHITDAEKALKKYHRKLKRAIKNGLISQDAFEFKMQHHKIAKSLEAIAHCDLVLECVCEDLEAKRKLVSELFQLLQPEALIASNTSSLFPAQLSNDPKQKQKLMGLHFFYPVETKAIVELVVNEYNRPEDIERLKDFAVKIGKKFLLQDQQDAFLLNRFMLKIQALAYNFAKENNYDFAQIDRVVQKHLFPMGIFEMMDFVGLDLIYKSAGAYIQDQNDKELYDGLLKNLEFHIAANQLGLKTNKGFYKYPQEKDEIEISTASEQAILSRLINDFEMVFQWAMGISKVSKADLEYFMDEYLDTEIKNWKNIRI